MTKTTADAVLGPIATSDMPSPSGIWLAAGRRALARVQAFRARRRMVNELRNLSPAQLRDIPETLLRDAGIEAEQGPSQHAFVGPDTRLLMLAMSTRG